MLMLKPQHYKQAPCNKNIAKKPVLSRHQVEQRLFQSKSTTQLTDKVASASVQKIVIDMCQRPGFKHTQTTVRGPVTMRFSNTTFMWQTVVAPKGSGSRKQIDLRLQSNCHEKLRKQNIVVSATTLLNSSSSVSAYFEMADASIKGPELMLGKMTTDLVETEGNVELHAGIPRTVYDRLNRYTKDHDLRFVIEIDSVKLVTSFRMGSNKDWANNKNDHNKAIKALADKTQTSIDVISNLLSDAVDDAILLQTYETFILVIRWIRRPHEEEQARGEIPKVKDVMRSDLTSDQIYKLRLKNMSLDLLKEEMVTGSIDYINSAL